MNEQMHKAIEAANNHYAYLQDETVFLEEDEQRNMIVINWHTFMDAYISPKRVMQIANFLRKRLSGVKIYSAYNRIF